MNLDILTCKELQLLRDFLTWLDRYRLDVRKGLDQVATTLKRKEWERFIDVNRLMSLLEKHASADGRLDDIVHDLTAAMAADVNNTGLEKQLNWLLDQGCAPAFLLECLGITNPDLAETCRPFGPV